MKWNKKLLLLWTFSLSFFIGFAQNGAQKKSEPERGALMKNGNYAMFIHWGLYANLAGKWKDKTYYGISEWIMNKSRANIAPKEYLETAKTFNPINFNAKAIVSIAKKAGMKYIIITAKHHDGFGMFHSKVNRNNIVEATPFARDPMKELAEACKQAGLGFGFYYSQNQDWSTPGGNGGPKVDENGKVKTFDDYFNSKCVPEVEQLTTEYGPITLIWFDTPGEMDKKYSQTLVNIVHKNQPGAFVSGRVGNGLGDYETFGDMEIPIENIPGIWETVDVTNDSWGYAWYDNNWKDSKKILQNVISTVGRGGTYMLNVGPKPDGTIPYEAQLALEGAGKWIAKNPEMVYNAAPSPWKHALPWGDAVMQGNKIVLAVYNWPQSGHLYIPGMQNVNVLGATLKYDKTNKPLGYKKSKGWLDIQVPMLKPMGLVNVITLSVNDPSRIESGFALDKEFKLILDPHYAKVSNCSVDNESWMEKFGEWKFARQIKGWNKDATASWDIEVLSAGYYNVGLIYKGTGRLVWKISTDEDQLVQNEQASSAIYQEYPMGWLKFNKPGKHRISVALVEGENRGASLKEVILKPITN